MKRSPLFFSHLLKMPCITIEDDGVGIDDMSRLENGYGVRNVIERIKLNYGEKYGVTFESSPGNGTKVTIVVPVR